MCDLYNKIVMLDTLKKINPAMRNTWSLFSNMVTGVNHED